MNTTLSVFTTSLALACTPFLVASQSAPGNQVGGDQNKSAPPTAAKPSAVTGQFMSDATPIKVGDKIALFNGKDLSGWKGFVPDLIKAGKESLSVWSVAKDGTDSTLQCAGNPIGYIETEALYDNFVLELDWRFDAAKGPGNSGVLLRTTGEDKVWPKSMEAQLESKSAGDFWNIDNVKATVAAKRTDGRHTTKLRETNEYPLGQWNHYRIVVNQGTIELWVNGLMQNVATDVEVVRGRIALQSEGAYIEFKNINLFPIVK